MKPVPKTRLGWIKEIRSAQLNAAEAIRFGPLAGVDVSVEELFHLAPIVALKFRELPATRSNLKRATDAVLSSCAVVLTESPGLQKFPTVLFAFAYLASHFGLDLATEGQVTAIMDYISSNPIALLTPTRSERSRGRTVPRQTLPKAATPKPARRSRKSER